MKALDERFGQGIHGLEARWREVVGDALARHCEPVKLAKARAGAASLEIRVDGPSASLIQHQSEEIIARVNMFLGHGAVGRLRIIQGPLRGSASRKLTPQTARPAPNRPLDAAAEKDLAERLAGLAEGPLRQALTKLGRKVLSP